MKIAFLISLLIIAILAFGTRNEAQAVIEDTTFHHADWPACVTVRPLPLLRTPHGRVDYRQGVPANDKGVS